MKFKDLGLCNEILSSIHNIGYKEPTEIQKKAIPNILIGRDIESLVLTRAINWHLEHRIIINENRTVVFN